MSTSFLSFFVFGNLEANAQTHEYDGSFWSGELFIQPATTNSRRLQLGNKFAQVPGVTMAPVE